MLEHKHLMLVVEVDICVLRGIKENNRLDFMSGQEGGLFGSRQWPVVNN